MNCKKVGIAGLNITFNQFKIYEMLQCQDASNILETSVGGGFHLPTVLLKKPKDQNYCSTDISQEMLRIAIHGIRLYESGKYNDQVFLSTPLEQQEILKWPVVFQNLRLTIQQADNENLPFVSNYFDRYISVLSLHLVSDPLKMLTEAFRVLSQGGKIGTAVWGSREKSQIFQIFPKIMKQNNIDLPNIRSPFHLNDEKKIEELFKQAGFKNIKTWYSYQPLLNPSKTLFEFIIPRNNKELFEKQSTEIQKKILQECQAEIDELLKGTNTIGIDILYTIAEKY